ncbi:MAG: protoporphyrinogen oxidase [Chloroflexota bacterium]|nr:MAG: protoporphyrinogen oxidase [Chloroflexota bacterium]
MSMKRIVVIGGGAAGLASAFALKRAVDAGKELDWILLEKDNRLGGKIQTVYEDDFIVDGGPDCYLSEKPWMAQMAARVGISEQLLGSNDARKKTYIYASRKLHELPDGVMMMVPTRFLPFATTSLFSWPAKLRMGMELFVPRKSDGADETLASFVRRRLGRECLDRLAEPMVGGVHASDPEQMSLRATFPRFLEMEQKYGSLIRAFIAARGKMPPPPPPKPGAIPRTYFMTFQKGMQQITDAMADAAGREKLLTGKQVSCIEERPTQPHFRVHATDGTTYEADAVIVSAEAYLAASFLRELDNKLADVLDSIPWTSAATVSLAYRAERLGHDLHGFGFLVPGVEKCRLMAATFSSTKWLGRAPAGHALIRAFVGGPHNQALAELEDDEMIRTVRDELREIMGVEAEPEKAWVFRWLRGMPQYTLGHLERLEFIDRRIEDHPGLFLCGNSYRGIGTGDCMNSGEQAVTKALQLLFGE